MGNTVQYSTKCSIVNHPKFERSQILPQKEIMKVQFCIQNEKQIDQWQSKVSKHQQQIQIPQYFLLPQSYQLSEKGFCGAACIMTIFYQNYPYIFQDQIQNRMKRKQYFSQPELWYLLYILVNCANEFSRIFDCKVGDIRPRNIFFNEKGQIKLANQFSWPGQIDNYHKSYHERESTFVSPQQMLSYTNLQNPIDTAHNNYEIAQSFSIGLTVLQAGLLFDFSSLYNFRTFKMDHQKLMRKFKQWSQLVYFSEQQGKNSQYSSSLKNIVLGLCELDPSKRVSSLQVHKWLIPYERQIISMDKFAVITSPIQRSGFSSGYTSNKIESISQMGKVYQQKYLKSFKLQQYEPKQPKQIINANNYYHKPTITFNNNYQTSRALKIEDLASQPFQFGAQNKKMTNYERKNNPQIIFQTFNPEFSKGKPVFEQQKVKISNTIKQVQTTQLPKITRTKKEQNQTNRLQQAKYVQSQYRADSSLSNTLKQLMKIHQKQKPQLQWSSDILKKIDQQIEYSKKYFPE